MTLSAMMDDAEYVQNVYTGVILRLGSAQARTPLDSALACGSVWVRSG